MSSSVPCWMVDVACFLEYVEDIFVQFFVSEHWFILLGEISREICCVRGSEALGHCPDDIWARVDLVE